MRHKLLVILGTRPEAIKLAPIILKLKGEASLGCRVCVTAQHRQMLDQVLDVFGIVPDTDLDLMRSEQTLADFTGRALMALDRHLTADRPDLILVQGDTTTVFCATLAAFYHHLPVGHVEAGLRTWNLDAPWPEEANRVLTSRLATLHFAPTRRSRDNLRREGVPAGRVFVTGNTVVDALFLALSRLEGRGVLIAGLPAQLQPMANSRRSDQGVHPRLVLITGHRRESFGEGFENICHAIRTLAARYPDVHFVYPVHLNPRVREPVTRILGVPAIRRGARSAGLNSKLRSSGDRRNIHLIEPLPYLSFIALMNRSYAILTDSGGIQEEAPSLGIPVLVMRETTERPEAVKAGTVRLVGTKASNIIAETSLLLSDLDAYRARSRKHNPYGDGHAAERIVRACRHYLRSHVPA